VRELGTSWEEDLVVSPGTIVGSVPDADGVAPVGPGVVSAVAPADGVADVEGVTPLAAAEVLADGFGLVVAVGFGFGAGGAAANGFTPG